VLPPYPASKTGVETDKVERVFADVDTDCCNCFKVGSLAGHGTLLVLLAPRGELNAGPSRTAPVTEVVLGVRFTYEVVRPKAQAAAWPFRHWEFGKYFGAKWARGSNGG
jgi:hypothetical protein